MPSPTRLTIGSWTADPAANELTRGAETVRVEPRMMEVLLLLAERPGETVSRDELLDHLWPGVVVTDDALSGAVSKLRRVLGDDARAPEYIETIPRTGYRLVAPVSPAEARPSEAEPPDPSPPATASRRRPLVAFLLATVVLLGAFAWWAQRSPRADAPLSLRPLSRAAGVEQYPALDPTGERLAFAARARDSTYYHLFIQDLDAETPLQLTEAGANDIRPVWSPDGHTLAFLRCRALRCHVYTVPVLGGTPRRRTEATVSPYGLAWLPDAPALLAVDRDTTTRPYQLLRLDLATGERRTLTAPPDGALGDFTPAVGPNGMVAFVRHDQSGGEDLYVLRPGSGTATRLTTEAGRIRGFAWNPDSRALLFSARREGTVGLWRVPASGGPLERAGLPSVRDPGGLALGPGRSVVESWTIEVHLWEATLAAGSVEPRPLIVSAAANREPALSPDGTRLAFISDRSGTPELWVSRRDGTQLLRLTELGGTGLGAPVWLMDGERIAFEVQRQGRAAIYVVGADGGTPQPLTDAAGYDVVPRPSRDGHWLYFGSDRSGSWEVWKVGLETDSLVQVTTEGGFAAMESPDGRTLYFTRYFEPGLWAMPAAGGPAELITDALGPLDWGNWSITETGLVWLDRRAETPRVLHLDPANGRVTTVFTMSDVPVREVALSTTPDGQTLVIARTARVESDLWLIEPER